MGILKNPFTFIAVLFAAVIYFVYFYTFDFSPRNYDKENVPDFEFTNIRISHINNGEVETEFFSDKAVIYKNSDQVILEETKGTLFFTESSSVVFEAPHAEFSLKTNRLDLQDAYMAFIEGENHLWMDSKLIQWSPQTLSILALGETNAYYDDMHLESDFLELDTEKRQLFVKNKPVISVALDQSGVE